MRAKAEANSAPSLQPVSLSEESERRLTQATEQYIRTYFNLNELKQYIDQTQLRTNSAIKNAESRIIEAIRQGTAIATSANSSQPPIKLAIKNVSVSGISPDNKIKVDVKLSTS